MNVFTIHWGWITPGVPQCNRELQIPKYLAFLDGETGRADSSVFNFTQPGWLLDTAISPECRTLTADCPEAGKSNQPLPAVVVQRLRNEIRCGRLAYVAYPYSGAVLEGMTGESALRALRLAAEVANRELGTAPAAFFVHDGPFQLDWGSVMVPQLGRLAGFQVLCGRTYAWIDSPDGLQMLMLGQPEWDSGLLYTGTEAPDATEHTDTIRSVHGDDVVRFVGLDQFMAQATPPRRRMSATEVRTKGWYGGAPLVMQMQAALRRSDCTLSIAQTFLAAHGRPLETNDLWKKSLILQDCHLQWLLCDLERHYLPATRQLERKVSDCLHQAVANRQTSPALATNPLSFPRAGTWPTPNGAFAFGTAKPFAVATPIEVPPVVATHECLANDRIRVAISPVGRIEAVFEARGQPIYRGKANQLRHWCNVPAAGAFLLQRGGTWDEGDGFSGCVSLETDVDLPAGGRYEFCFDFPRGLAIAFGRIGDEWTPATNRHWGGGLPSGNQEHAYSNCGHLDLPAGRSRLRLHAVADGGLLLRTSLLRRAGQDHDLRWWTGEKLTEWKTDPFVVETVEPRSMGARGEVVFHGHYATCQATLTLGLDYGSDRVDIQFTRQYPERCHEGFQTLPLPLEIGSYLGAYCERPYVPAWTVEADTAPWRTTYSSDKPYGFAVARDSADSWYTGRFREFFGGLTPFLGIANALAESANGAMHLMTDGHGHFFRRRTRPDHETLGLSLGSSAIHPMTQCYRMPQDSYWEKIGRRMGTDYEHSNERCNFVAPLGEISCSWSYLFTTAHELDRADCWRNALARLAPLMPGNQSLPDGEFKLAGEGIVLAAMERQDESLIVRLLNLHETERPFQLRLPSAYKHVDIAGDLPMTKPILADGCLSGCLPPLAVREFHLRSDDERITHDLD